MNTTTNMFNVNDKDTRTNNCGFLTDQVEDVFCVIQ